MAPAATNSGNNGVDLGHFNGDYPPWDLKADYEPWELASRHFPSKVGGKPAWLDLENLPSSSVIKCPSCGRPRQFLLQLYSPDEDVETGFHRTVYIFLCTSNACWGDRSSPSFPPVLVLRSQLKRENRFYPASPPVEDPTWRTDITPEKYGSLCPVCGCRGDKLCGRCRSVSYCGEHHQKMDWKRGHKQECKEGGSYGGPYAEDTLRPEGLVEIEEEPDEEDEVLPEQDEERYAELAARAAPVEAGDEDWREVEEGQHQDKASERFRARMRRAPRQIVRYCRRSGQGPLLCTASATLARPQACTNCGAERTFEFQVMPQLLSLLHLGTELESSLDWGSLYIFTCDKSCALEGYAEEVCQLLHFDANNHLPA